jgi:transcriptional regulator with XRE-family HTH domain
MVAVRERECVMGEDEEGGDDGRVIPRPLSPFNKWLKAAREERGWTQTELAHRAGLEQTEVSKWEIGKLRDPPPAKAHRFADALGVPYQAVWGVVGGLWPDAESLPPAVKSERGEVIPEFVRLLNLRLSPQEADFLGEVVQLQRRYTAGSLRAPGGEPGDTGTKDVPSDR